jgi:hypothetical protein
LFYLKYYGRGASVKNQQITIVSYPKSGRTWLENLLLESYLLNRQAAGQKTETLRDIIQTGDSFPFIRFTHAGSSWESLVTTDAEVDRIPFDLFAKGKVIFLHRDPRDVQVSAYHHIRYRTGVRGIRKEDMVNSPVVGLNKVIRFMNHWADFTARNPHRAMVLGYEDMKADTLRELKKVMDFIGLQTDEAMLKEAIHQCSFKRMQEKERKNVYKNPWQSARNRLNIHSFKVRSGKTGEHRSFFDPAQIREMNVLMENELNPFFGYC